MSVDKELRARVERLLRREFRVIDIQTLFLNLRSRHFARESFLEIGDFIAHKDTRNKGPATSITRDLAVISRFMMPLVTRVPNFVVTVENFRQSANATLRMIDDETLMARVDLRREEAKTILGRALKNISGFKGLEIQYYRAPKNKEATLIELLSTILPVKAVFTTEKLHEEFVYVLIRNGILYENEIKNLSYLKDIVSLFCISAMHGTKIDLGGGDFSRIATTISLSKNQINSNSIINLNSIGDKIQLAFPVLELNLDLRLHTVGLSDDFGEGILELIAPIELCDDMKLHKIGI